MALIFFTLIAYVSAFSDIDHRALDNHIIGGKVASPTRYPYYTYLDIEYRSGDGSFCGGSLVAQDMVLTAAHCIDSDDPITKITAKVNFTRSTGKPTGYEYTRKVIKRIPYPSYNPMSSVGDAALLLLDRPVVGVPLIKINGISTKPSDGQSVTVIGHGATSNQDKLPNSLMEVSESVISHQDCNDRNSYDGSIVFSAMLCAGVPEGGKGDCYGDSGGPLLIRGNNPNEDIQVGIVSFGVDSGCALPNLPSVFTRVSTYAKWIRDNICLNSNNKPNDCTGPNPPTPSLRPKPSPKPAKKPTRKPTRRPTLPPTNEPMDSPALSPVGSPNVFAHLRE